MSAPLESVAAVLSWLVCLRWARLPLDAHSLIFLLVVISLTYPGLMPQRLRLRSLLTQVAVEWILVLALLAVLGRLTDELHRFPESLLLAWALLTPALIVVGYSTTPWLLRWSTDLSGGKRTAVVVGGGPLGRLLARKLEAVPELALSVLGFFDDRAPDRLELHTATDNAWHLQGTEVGAGMPAAGGQPATQEAGLLGSSHDVGTYVRAHKVDVVYITLNMGLGSRNLALLDDLRDTTASIYYAPDLFLLNLVQAHLDDVDGIPVVAACESPFVGVDGLVKRASDLVLASLILVLISPVLLVLAVLVWRDGKGPVIFRQRRYGLAGEEIVVYKFRSMRVEEDGAEVRQATRGDTRITRLGAFLRRTSLDELPQFINVLQGRMSIVGPRPHAVSHNEYYRKLVGGYMVRHKVRPGITGWAQVNGYRGETDTLEKMQGRIDHDMEYLRNWSLRLDLLIIARTLLLVAGDRSAY